MTPLSLLLISWLAAAPPVAPPAGDLAVFWGGGRTWALDLATERLWVAPGWLSSAEGQVWRYRVRLEARAPARAADEQYRPASRWARVEQLAFRPGSAPAPEARAPWRALSPAPTPPAGGQLFDEQRVVQFTGEAMVVARHRRQRTADSDEGSIELGTLRLPTGEPITAPAGAADAVRWLARRVDGVVQPCVERPTGVLTLDLPGGRAGRWLALGGDPHRCGERAHALPLSVAPRPTAIGGARWADDALTDPSGRRVSPVADARPTPDGRLLVLEGPPLIDEPAILRDLDAVDAPCVERTLVIWQTGAEPRSLGQVPRLDGLRWLPPGDPLRAALPTWFQSVGGPPCFEGLALDGPLEVRAHACQLDESDRPWWGVDDLSAGASASFDGDVLRVMIAVHDPHRAEGDQVRLWIGDRRRPRRVTIRGDALQVRGSRSVRRTVTRQIEHTWSPTDRGYQLALALDRRLLGERPALSVRIDDVDAPDGEAVHLWLVGRPIDGRNPRATPIRIDADGVQP